jgi:hypothetical protein
MIGYRNSNAAIACLLLHDYMAALLAHLSESMVSEDFTDFFSGKYF